MLGLLHHAGVAMTEYVKLAQSYGHQELTWDKSGHERIRRWAMCPQHQRRSSDYRGQQMDISLRTWWTFRCKEKGQHLFNIKPDRSAPTTEGEVEAWLVKARLAKLDIKHGGQ